jgi:hypothetical protein
VNYEFSIIPKLLHALWRKMEVCDA